MRFKTGSEEEEMREDGEVREGRNQVGVKNLGVGRVGRLDKRGAPAERTGSDREARARPMSEAERNGRVVSGRGRVVDEGEDGWGMGRSKGLTKRGWWVRSTGNGSRLRD